MRRILLISGLMLLCAACAAPSATKVVLTEPARPTAMPTRTPIPGAPVDRSSGPHGWRLEGEPQRYDPETLYDLVNGAADLYFSYGFEQATVEQYVDERGALARVEVYRTATEADAYGLFTYHSYGEPVELGVDGELEPGYRLAFWQDKSFVQIVARETVDDDALWALGQAVAAELPSGGMRPAVVQALPAEGLHPGSIRFFREKLALDNLLWLGPDDLLGLGSDVEGVVARYEIEGQSADLLLVSFPNAARAERAQAGLQGGGVEGLVVAGQRDGMLGAVFGTLPKEAARALLEEAMDGAS